jgi:hypothetical protein
MFRVVLAAGVLVFALAAVRHGDVLERTNLVGGCSAIATPSGEAGAWQACRPGRLEGPPDLSRKSCNRRGLVAEVELWRCPAPLAASRTGST